MKQARLVVLVVYLQPGAVRVFHDGPNDASDEPTGRQAEDDAVADLVFAYWLVWRVVLHWLWLLIANPSQSWYSPSRSALKS